MELNKKLIEVEKENEELKFQVEELTDFIENVSVPLHCINGSGIVIWANQAEFDLLGFTKQEYLNKHISNFHVDKEIIENILTRLTKKETLRNYPARLRCKNGDIKEVLINSSVYWKNGEFMYTRCFTKDITECKKEISKYDQKLSEYIISR